MNLRYFWATLQFITRLPVPRRWSEGVAFSHVGRGVVWFPVVGLLVGGICALITQLFFTLSGSAFLSATLYVLLLIVVTGGFHLDGLADACDGLFSARSKVRMLEIMRDSRIGTYGSLALIFAILVKVITVAELLANSALTTGATMLLFVAVPVVGRTVMVLAMFRQRYARATEGMGNIYIGQVNACLLQIILITGTGLVIALAQTVGLIALLITGIVIYGFVSFCAKRLGGQTGDTLGAAEELGEITFLVVLVCLLGD